jgi:hypothetical protein
MIVVTILRLGASKLRASINACADIDTVTYASSVSARRVPRYAGRDVICKGYRWKRDCIVCLEMRAGELIRRLISGELTNYEVVQTSPEPLHYWV